MNHDMALVAAVLDSRDMAAVNRSGVRPQYMGAEARLYWEGILGHYQQFGEVPSVPSFTKMYPAYAHHVTGDSIEALVHEVKTRYLHASLNQLLESVATQNDADPWEARASLAKELSESLVTVQDFTTDLLVGSDGSDAMRRLDILTTNHGLLGMPWPVAFLNEHTKGLCAGNFVYLYGREKSRKTWILLSWALYYALELRVKVLFFTREMTAEELAWRSYILASGIDATDLQRGLITEEGKKNFAAAIQDLEAAGTFVISEIENGLAGMMAKIDEIRPGLVIHDYLEAIAEDEVASKKSANFANVIGTVAGKCKHMAMRKKIPFIACGHANRDGAKGNGKSTTDVAGSDKIIRRVDYGFRIITDDENNRTAVILNAGRDAAKFTTFTIDTHISHRFGTMLFAGADWLKEQEEEEMGGRAQGRPAEKASPSEPSPVPKDTFKRARPGR